MVENSSIMIPAIVPNYINNKETYVSDTFSKIDPVSEELLCHVAKSNSEHVAAAVNAARLAWPAWSGLSSVRRGKILLTVAGHLEKNKDKIAEIVSKETGKSKSDALSEVLAAVQLAEFFSGEGMRLYGRTLPSGNPHKTTITIRESHGVVGLIVAANTPIANIAWKVFPALICGNTVVLKASEDAPLTAWLFAQLVFEAGLSCGVFNVLHGHGSDCGMPLVKHIDVKLISFTGSTQVGKLIAAAAAQNLTRVSLELGGKNPFVVCDDADLERAVYWALLSSFSNAGQRCAASSRILIFKKVYDEFKKMFIEQTKQLISGNNEGEIGPVIKKSQLEFMLSQVKFAQSRGAHLLCGGHRVDRKGCFMQPTVLENTSTTDCFNDVELFGPITTLMKVEDLSQAIELSNQTAYGLTSAIHTSTIHSAMHYVRSIRAGVINVNAGTHGSEPHYPFGGFGQSGNGTREPGVEALDVYSEVKSVSFLQQ